MIFDDDQAASGALRKPISNRIRKAVIVLVQLALINFYAFLAATTFFMSELVEFVAFTGAGRKTLALESPFGSYVTAHGASVFQSVPWLAWLFVPLALLPLHPAWLLFVSLNIGLLLGIFIVNLSKEAKGLSPLNLIYLFSCVLVLSYSSLAFGQVTILQLWVITLVIVFLQRGNQTWAGMLMPFVLIKPHLVIWFLIYCFALGKRRFVMTSILAILLISAAAFALQPTWLFDLFDAFLAGQAQSTMESWRFSTLAGLFSLPPIYGLVVLPLAIPALFWVRRRTMGLSIKAQLAIALAFSLATSPYAFAYDLPLLLPCWFLLSRRWSCRALLFWTLGTAFVIGVGFRGFSYVVTLATCALIVVKLVRSPGGEPVVL